MCGNLKQTKQYFTLNKKDVKNETFQSQLTYHANVSKVITLQNPYINIQKLKVKQNKRNNIFSTQQV